MASYDTAKETVEGDMIPLDTLIEYTEKIAEESKIDPCNVIKELLISSEIKGLVTHQGDIDLSKLRAYLVEHPLIDDDMVDIVLCDVAYISGANGKINIDQFSSYVRNQIEGFER